MQNSASRKCPICKTDLPIIDHLQDVCCYCGLKVCTACSLAIESGELSCPKCRNRQSTHNNKLKHQQNLHELQQSLGLNLSLAIQNYFFHLFRGLDLTYLIGLSPELAKEQILSRFEYLGQFGQIKKITIGKNQVCNSDGYLSFAAYVNFNNEKEASFAILALADFEIDEGRIIRASYGTTKYCTNFLKNQNCSNLDCVYLHHFHNNQKIYQKDEILNNKSIFQEQYQIALNVAFKYKQDLIQLINSQEKNNCQKQIFPSLQAVLDKLLDYEEKNNLISNDKQEADKKQFEPLKQQQNSAHKQNSQQKQSKKVIKKCQASFVGWDFGKEEEEQLALQMARETSSSIIESSNNSPQLKSLPIFQDEVIEEKIINSESKEDAYQKMEELDLNEQKEESEKKCSQDQLDLENENNFYYYQHSRFNFTNQQDEYCEFTDLESSIQNFIKFNKIQPQQIGQEILEQEIQLELNNQNIWQSEEENDKNDQFINFEKYFTNFSLNPEDNYFTMKNFSTTKNQQQQFPSKTKLLKQLSKQETNQFQQQQSKLSQSLSLAPQQMQQQQQIKQIQQPFSFMKTIYQHPEYEMHIEKSKPQQQRIVSRGPYGNIIYNYHTIQYNVNNNINLTNNFYKL